MSPRKCYLELQIQEEMEWYMCLRMKLLMFLIDTLYHSILLTASPIESWAKKAILRGPKRCGGSVSLVALLTHLYDKKVLYVTADTLRDYKQNLVQTQLKSFFKDIGPEQEELQLSTSMEEFPDFLSLSLSYCKTSHLYLVDRLWSAIQCWQTYI